MWEELLCKLRVARMVVDVELREETEARGFVGAAVRGAFGRALRGLSCLTGAPTCAGCNERARCTYDYLFETAVPLDAARMRRYPFAPHPLILRPPRAGTSWRSGETASLEVVLVGAAVEQLPMVLCALREAGAEGPIPWVVRGAELLEPEPRRVLDGTRLGDGPYGTPVGRLLAKPRAGDQAVEFVTPTRIVYRGRPSGELPLHIVIRSLLRRLSSLAYFHEGIALNVDFRGVISSALAVETACSALRWHDQHRRSRRQGQTHALGGVVGEVTYANVPSELATLLEIGSLTHVGKATMFGMGQFTRRAA